MVHVGSGTGRDNLFLGLYAFYEDFPKFLGDIEYNKLTTLKNYKFFSGKNL